MLAHWQAATLSYKLHKFGGFVFVFNGGIATLKQTPARKHQLKYGEHQTTVTFVSHGESREHKCAGRVGREPGSGEKNDFKTGLNKTQPWNQSVLCV